LGILKTMATILKGKFKGKEAKIKQWCDDWFSIEVDEFTKIVTPTSLQLTPQEMAKVLEHDNNGFMLRIFEPTLDGRFKRKII